jgi:Arc/MetJ-type ribon-helix-helix transcriptional regulator
MEVLNIKVEKEFKEKLERLVKRKAYKNKSEAVRKMLEEYFEEHPELFASEELAEILKEANKMSDEQFERLAAEIFRGPTTAAEIVAEGRDRYP